MLRNKGSNRIILHASATLSLQEMRNHPMLLQVNPTSRPNSKKNIIPSIRSKIPLFSLVLLKSASILETKLERKKVTVGLRVLRDDSLGGADGQKKKRGNCRHLPRAFLSTSRCPSPFDCTFWPSLPRHRFVVDACSKNVDYRQPWVG